MRLKSHIWASGYLRRLDTRFVSCAMVRRGDPDAGAIFIKLTRRDGRAQVLSPVPAYLLDGERDRSLIAEDGRAWSLVFPDVVPDAEAEAYLKRQASQDSDIWILEVETPDGTHYLGEAPTAA